MDEKRPTRQEVLEAESLSRALEGDGSAPDIPDDALAAAALLRYSRDGGELSADRLNALRSEIVTHAEEIASRVSKQRTRRSWLAPVGVLASGLAAVGLAVVLVTSPEPGAPLAPTPIPVPSDQLLMAQMSAAEGNLEGLAALTNEMRLYRGELYDALSDRYRGSE